ncbi:hypothetical protein SD77_0080 [Bacillus badius]|uniref:Uncharacterized protein n=1 Tax=Bacillus badius TaxID=1455 RepID=A0ABR5AZV1_BACBA|nr:hypothetical protein SD77_0080 [Bacillus badius]
MVVFLCPFLFTLPINRLKLFKRMEKQPVQYHYVTELSF